MRAATLGILLVASCAAPADWSGHAERWPDADALFRREPRWLGGDGAYSIDLGGDRSLWLFGDSFIATSPALVRTESTLVRNSIAVMTGRDPLTATMDVAWTDAAPPAAFFPDDGDHWFWPTDGVRVPGGPLVVFLSELRPTPGEGLGFAGAGWRAVRVADPDASPGAWTREPVPSLPAPHDPEAAIACSRADGNHLVALVVDGSSHDGRLARWPLVDVAAGDLTRAAWWDGTAWVDAAALAGAPAIVLPDGATECSLSRDRDGRWHHVQSRGFGATTLAIRTADAIEGPWSAPVDVMTPPESEAPGAFVYAGKAHPQLAAGDGFDLVITYATNSFDFADLFDPANVDRLYWPRVVRAQLAAR